MGDPSTNLSAALAALEDAAAAVAKLTAGAVVCDTVHDVGWALARARRAHGMSAKAAAEKIGINMNTVYQREDSTYPPKLEGLIAHARALGLRIALVPITDPESEA